jgi:putative lipoic acid-binding regulatory protein
MYLHVKPMQAPLTQPISGQEPATPRTIPFNPGLQRNRRAVHMRAGVCRLNGWRTSLYLTLSCFLLLSLSARAASALATPTLAVSTSGSPSIYKSSVTITVKISSGPTGTVKFYDGGVSIGTGTISGTTATLSTSSLTAGSHTLTASWAGNGNYAAVTSKAVTQKVSPAVPAITWATPAAITYRTALSATQLNATASVAGTFAYTPSSGTVLGTGADKLSVKFTPTDATDYSSVTDTVTLTVNKGTPTIAWTVPAAISYGTALSATQLDATASVGGTFAYTPTAGTVLAAGAQTLSVTFTPTQTNNYNPASHTVKLTVNPSSTATLGLSATSVAFGNVVLNTPATQSVTLTSTGTAAVTVNAPVVTGNGFTVSAGTFPVTLKPGQTASLTAQFNPTAAGAASGQLTITSNSSTGASTAIALSGTGTAATSHTYSTAFPLTENPISESGNWINGGTAGQSWNNCRTTAGFAFGTQSGANPSDDSTCLLTGTWGPNQTAQSTVKVKSSSNANYEEVEVRLRSTMAAKSSTGYEISCSVIPGDPYYQIVRWNGALGDFTMLAFSSTVGCANGDVLKATISGSTITAYKNGTAILTANDATYTSGQPGMGFSMSGLTGTIAAADAEFGSSGFSAADGQSGTPSATPTALACSSSTMTGTGTDACTVTLNGAAPSGGLSVSLASSNAAVTLPATMTVPANATSAAFTATVSSVTTAQTATLTATAGGASQTFALKLNAVTSTLSSSATSVAFGSVVVNTPATQSVTLTSTGTAPITVSAATVTGTGFTVSGATFPVTLNPGQTASLTAQFNPTAAGAASGQLTITSNSSTGASTAIALSGTGTAATSHTYSTAFPLTENPISESGNWINGGTAGQSWNNCRTTAGFAYGTQSGASEYDDSTCLLTGTWGPNQTAQTTVKIKSSSTSTYEEVEVRVHSTMTAKSSTGYEISCSVIPSDPYYQIVRWNGALGDFTMLAFSSTVGCADGDVLKATISGSTITAYKNGTAILTANDATYASGQPGMGFFILGVTGTYAAANAEFGSSNYSATDGQSGTTSATPTALACSSSSMTGKGTDACTVTLNGAAPSGGLTVSLSSSNAAVTLPATVTVPANATSATFTATVVSVATAQTVTLTATAGGVSQTFALNLGTGTSTLSVNAASVAFGSVPLNTPATQSVILTSTGTASLTISAATVAGAGFTVSGATLPVTLSAGQALTLEVQFEPTVAGAASGQLTITSNSSTGTTKAIALSGTGTSTSYQVNLSWSAPSSSTDSVVGYNIYRSPNGSSAYQLLNSTEDAQTTYIDTTTQSGLTYDYMVESVDSSGVDSSPSNMAVVTVP